MKRTLRRHRGFSARPLLALVLAAGSVIAIALPAAAGPKQPRSGKGGPSGTSTTTTTTTTTTDSSGVQTFEGEKTPAAPTELAVQPLTGGGFKVVWKDNATNETGYEVERLPAFAGGAALLGPDSIGFVDQQDQASVEYRVRARGVTLQSSWTSWAQGQSATSSFVILPPGSGFGGATAQPAAVGSAEMPGYDAKAIARWDVVPYQTFTGNFHIGVVAFHMNGIDRVEFSANGGPWKSVTEMQLNPLTNVWEYTAMLRAADFADGPVEVRAVVYPKGAGEVRVLGGALATGLATGEHSMFLSANAMGSLRTLERHVSPTGDDIGGDGSPDRPFATIMKAAKSIQIAQGSNADGGKIYLAAGDHVLGTYSFSLATTTVNRWLTVTPAPGVDRSAARIIRAVGDGLRMRLVRLSNVTCYAATGADQAMLVSNGPLEDFLWLDQCALIGPGRTVNAGWGSGFTGVFSTGVSYRNARDGAWGVLVRDADVQHIGSDAFSGSMLAANCSADEIDSSGTSFHADALQFYSTAPINNRIAYGVTVRTHDGQGFFAGDGIVLNDIAFVNCHIDNQFGAPNVARVFQFGGPTAHMFVKQCTFIGPTTWMQNFAATNCVLDGCTFSDQLDVVSGVTVR